MKQIVGEGDISQVDDLLEELEAEVVKEKQKIIEKKKIEVEIKPSKQLDVEEVGENKDIEFM